MARKSMAFPILLLLALVLGACGDGADTDDGLGEPDQAAPGTEDEQPDEPIELRIGYVGTLSGPASFLGTAPRQGVELAIEQINADGYGGREFDIRLIAEDDELDPGKGVAAAQKLVSQDRVDVVIGSAHSGVSLAMLSVTEQAQVPQISPLSALNDLTEPPRPYFFRFWNKDAVIAATLTEFALENFERVGILYETTAFGQGGKDALEAAFQDRGSQVVRSEAFDLDAQDLTPQLVRLRNADAEAIIVQTQGPQAALTVRNMEQLGWDAPIIGHPGLAQAGFVALSQGAAEGAIVIDGIDRDKPATQEFIAAYEERFGEELFSFYPATGYDIVHLILHALELVDFDTARLADGLEQVEGFEGVIGRPGASISYGPDDRDGHGADALIFKEIRDGRLAERE